MVAGPARPEEEPCGCWGLGRVVSWVGGGGGGGWSTGRGRSVNTIFTLTYSGRDGTENPTYVITFAMFGGCLNFLYSPATPVTVTVCWWTGRVGLDCRHFIVSLHESFRLNFTFFITMIICFIVFFFVSSGITADCPHRCLVVGGT